MSNSFVGFNTKGFWIKDWVLSLSCSYILTYISKWNCVNDYEAAFIEGIKSCGFGYNSGFLSMDLDKNLKSKAEKDKFLQLLNKIVQDMKTKSIVIEPAELNTIQLDVEYNGEWSEGIPRASVIKVLEYLVLLISGKLSISVSDPVDYDF